MVILLLILLLIAIFIAVMQYLKNKALLSERSPLQSYASNMMYGKPIPLTAQPEPLTKHQRIAAALGFPPFFKEPEILAI